MDVFEALAFMWDYITSPDGQSLWNFVTSVDGKAAIAYTFMTAIAFVCLSMIVMAVAWSLIFKGGGQREYYHTRQ